MKKIYTIIFLIAVSTTVMTAQNKDTKKADELYERLAYTDAAEAYQKLLKKGKGSRYVFERLGNSYYFLNDTKKAETYYKRVVKGRDINPETLYNYAQALKANGKFADYNTYMKEFAAAKPNDSRAIDFMKNPDYVPMLMEEMPRYEATNMKDLNTAYSEFGGTMVGKDFYFSSARNTSRKTYQWDEQPFLDLYRAKDVGGTIKDARLVNGAINTKYHEGNVTITADGKRMYFDRNDYFEGDYDKSEDGINQINLYSAENVGGEWKDIKSLSLNSDEYSSGHPALSPDGNTLYFVSDRPGGKGGSDIYMASVSKDGTLGAPQRLGDHINTEGKEVFPFIDANGTLYFSSDGHMGIGLLDVFMAEANGNDFAAPTNLGKGVNSEEDDFAFRFDPASKTGFVSSNRKGGKGKDDIYMIKELEQPCVVMMNIQVVNEYTDAPISGARVDLYDTLENKLSTKTTDTNGRVSFKAECDIAHEVQAVMKDFESNAIDVDAANETEVDGTIKLRPIEAIMVDDKVELDPIYFDLDKHNIKPKAAFELDKLVELMKKYSNMKIAVGSHTDNRASDAYNMQLSERRAQSTVQYVISKGIDADRISGKGYGESQPAVDCGDNCTKEQHAQNRRSEFTITER